MAKRKYDPSKVVEETVKGTGYTVQPMTGDVPTTGTMVSIPGNEEPVPVSKLNTGVVSSFVEAPSRSKLFKDTTNFLGTWRSSDYGLGEDVGVLDVSKNFPDTPEGSQQARKAAMSGDQWAVWNIDRGVTEANLGKPDVREKMLGHGIEIDETPEEYVSSTDPVGTHVSYGYLTKPRHTYTEGGRRVLEAGAGQGMFLFPGTVENIDETEQKRQQSLGEMKQKASEKRKASKEQKNTKTTMASRQSPLFG